MGINNDEPLKLQQFPENIDSIQPDKTNLNHCLISGAYEEHIMVNGIERTFVTYLTEGLENDQRCIIVAPPSNIDTMLYLEQSGWRTFADVQKVFLHILVPLDHAWNYDGSDADYMNAVYVQVQARDYYVTLEDGIYAFGVGNGAAVAHQAAMKMTGEWSGLATIGNIDSTAMLNVKVNVQGKGQSCRETTPHEKKSQMPVWMVWDKTSHADMAVLNYWKTLNNSAEPPLSGAGADEIYLPDTIQKKSGINEEFVSQVRVTNGISFEKSDNKLLDVIWQYIGSARRHRGFGGKFLRNFKDPAAYGAVRRTMEVDGYTRVWYEYIPDKVKHRGVPVPLVVCMHGRGVNAEAFFDISGMSVVAEERDFIAIFPQAGVCQQKPKGIRNVLRWNDSYPDNNIGDIKFIRMMLEDIENRIPVDKGRVYACGHSSGGKMTSWLGQKAPDLFTAVAPWSAPALFIENSPVPESITPAVPYLFMFGEDDPGCVDKNNCEFPFNVNKSIAEFFHYIIKIYKLSPEPQSYRCGEITYYIYRNAKGTPLLIAGRVADMPHAYYPRESFISYDQFFAKFSRTKDGTLLYMGQPAD